MNVDQEVKNGSESEKEQETSKGVHKQWKQQQHQRPWGSSTAPATGIPTRNTIRIGSENTAAAGDGGEDCTHFRTDKKRTRASALIS